MTPPVIEPGPRANRPPGLFDVHERSAFLRASDDMRIAVEPRHLGEDGKCGRRKMQGLGAAFAVRQPRLATLEIDPLPTQPECTSPSRAPVKTSNLTAATA